MNELEAQRTQFREENVLEISRLFEEFNRETWSIHPRVKFSVFADTLVNMILPSPTQPSSPLPPLPEIEEEWLTLRGARTPKKKCDG